MRTNSVFDGETDLCNPFRNGLLLLVYIFLDRGISNSFYLAFHIVINHHSACQKTNIGFYQLLNMRISIIHSGNGE